MKVSEVPTANPNIAQDYRTYKLQFQAPPNIQTFTWKLCLISDTFVGEEVTRDISVSTVHCLRYLGFAHALLQLKIEEARQEELKEDEISDPEEDSLAGQMAMMRGGSVKKRKDEEESDDESSTDDDKESDPESSDSD